MAVNCPSPVKIAIINGAPIETPVSNLEKFTNQVGKEVGDDFNSDHEGKDVFSRIRQAPSTHLSVVRYAFSQLEEADDWIKLQSFTHSIR